MHSLSLFVVFLCITVNYVRCKPVTEVLPHSRDYYAGYIKAITDNFEQLFANDRQTRSTDDDDETDTEDKKSVGVQTAKDQDENSKQEVKKDVTEKTSPKVASETQQTEVVAKKESIETTKGGAQKKSETKENDSETKSSDEKASLDKKSNDEEDFLDEKSNDRGEDSVDKKNKDEENSNKKSDMVESKDEVDDPEESEVEDDASDGAMRRAYVLEHSNMNAPIFPHVLSGYQEEHQSPEEEPVSNSEYGQLAMPYGVGPPPNAFGPFVSNIPLGTGTVAGTTRQFKPKNQGTKGETSNCNGDNHHLHRILVLPDCCHGNHRVNDCCFPTYHHCNNHNNHHGSHQLVHDIHHWPVGCPEHYSHESPCLTYPHYDNVGYGYADNCCCQSHHPVILHPTHQECHHHNIHVAGTDCYDGNHGCYTTCGNNHDCYSNCGNNHGCYTDCGCEDNCGCGHNCGCTHHVNIVHSHHPTVVHHVYDNCHATTLHHGRHGNHHGVVILPHYGHTTTGHHGWNPYWGH